MSYADPQEFRVPPGYPSVPHEAQDDDSTKSGQKQSVYSIPGYIAYTMTRHDGACTTRDVSLNFKGLDNPAFHHHLEANHKLIPPALPPCRGSEIAKNVNCNNIGSHNNNNGVVLNPYSNAIYAEMTHEKSSCCKQWTIHLMPSVKNRKCVILSVLISAIVLLVAALVVVLFLTVGGGMELFNSSSKSETVQKGNTVVNGTFRISSVAYDADLADPSTKLYDILRLEVSNAVFMLFNKSSIGENYNRSELIGFRNGSVIVDLRVFLSTPREDVAAKVTSAFVKGLVNMHGTVLLDKFVVDIRSISFKVDDSFERSLLKSSTSSAAVYLKSPESSSSNKSGSSTPVSSTSESTTAVADQRPSSVKTAVSAHSYQRTNSSRSDSFHSSPSLSSSSTSATSTSAVLLQRQTPLSATHRVLQQSRPNSFPVVSAAAPHLKLPWNSGNNTTAVPTTTSLSPILSSASSSALRTPFVSNSSYNHRPSHPFLRPPPTGIYPPSSRTRPGIPPHFQMDFADSPGWSSWSAWSACGNGFCVGNRNYTQMRTRDCRTRNGTGEVLTDNKECLLKKGGMRFEIRRCTCKLSIPTTSIITTTAHPNFTGRPCHECTADEICLAKHSDKEATCRPPLDAKDATGCGGWCDPAYEYCQHLATGAKKCIDDRVCLPDEWQCGNGLCVPLEKRCDGHFNCYDTTDELNCKCDEQKNIRCGKNTSCLPLEKRCNFIIDCWDGSDEENCTKKCPNGEFTCTYGQCIPNMYFCDGLIDCQDGSDEPEGCNDTCINGEFRCANGRCIKQALVCDGADTCGDGSDERTANCSRRAYVPAYLSTRTLSRRDADPPEAASKLGTWLSSCPNATHFQCSSGQCISKRGFCDGRVDCPNGEDERICPKNQTSASPSADCVPNEEFKCTNSKCIKLKFICDLVDHCGDSSDESEAVCQHRDSSH